MAVVPPAPEVRAGGDLVEPIRTEDLLAEPLIRLRVRTNTAFRRFRALPVDGPRGPGQGEPGTAVRPDRREGGRVAKQPDGTRVVGEKQGLQQADAGSSGQQRLPHAGLAAVDR